MSSMEGGPHHPMAGMAGGSYHPMPGMGGGPHHPMPSIGGGPDMEGGDPGMMIPPACRAVMIECMTLMKPGPGGPPDGM